jgi:Domain of unknown function (DUF4968)
MSWRSSWSAMLGVVRLAVVLVVLAVAPPLAAEWQPIGAVTPATPQGNQITFRGSHGLVNISILAPDLVRVRMTSGASFGPDYSWAVIKPLSDWPIIPTVNLSRVCLEICR